MDIKNGQFADSDNGSMFQLVKSKEARRDDGEHYTSEKNILKTIAPLFLDELRAEAKRLINAKSTPVKKLQEFRDSLAEMVFTDPAIIRKSCISWDTYSASKSIGTKI